MLAVRHIRIHGYRSVRSAEMDLGALNVFVGRNGAGKTNLYRGLQLLQAAALGSFAREIAGDGGMEAVLWAGKRIVGQQPRIILSATLAPEGGKGSYTYEIEAGIAPPDAAAFALEPHIKSETITFFDGRRKHELLARRGPSLVARDAHGDKQEISRCLLASETALSAFAGSGDFPDQVLIRNTLAAWRFYHDLRTDSASPMRKPSLAATATMLDADGGNLAAVFATLRHIRGDTADLDAAIDDAFPGAELESPRPTREAAFALTYPDFVLDGGGRRLFAPQELSDGTLRYLGLAGALFAYHRPPLLAINEPEGSLHTELMQPLARMIVKASEKSQLWVVTHSQDLAQAIANITGTLPREVVKRQGATEID